MKIIRDIPYGREAEQLLDIYLPESEEFSVFVYFHGGGFINEERTRDPDMFAEYLTDRNVAVVSADYRKYPTAEYPDFIRDAAAAVAWTKNNIESYGKCDKIYVGGCSAGAYLSMMLCFDKKYLAPYNIDPSELGGFVHAAGQPTAHFNILREKGIDGRRVIIDETAPLYHVGTSETYAPMQFLVSDNDIDCRYEQIMLIMSTMKHFGHEKKTALTVTHGGHCQYGTPEKHKSDLGRIVYEFILKSEEMR